MIYRQLERNYRPSDDQTSRCELYCNITASAFCPSRVCGILRLVCSPSIVILVLLIPLFCSEDLDRFGAGMAVAVQGGSVITVMTKGPRLPKLGHLSCSASHYLFVIPMGIASWWKQWNVHIAATWCPSQRLLVKSSKSARIHNVGLSWASWASDCARHENFYKVVFEFADSFSLLRRHRKIDGDIAAWAASRVWDLPKAEI